MNKTQISTLGSLLWFAVLLVLLAVAILVRPVRAAGTTYYVSSSDGSDSNDGLSESTPFKTVAKVNSLNLQPGDRVLFKCGDTWRAEQLIIRWAGTESNPITFSSYPAGCANKPILSGSLPITGWAVHAGPIYWADVPESTFPLGINQLFRNGQRLTLGRWPNLGTANGGYSFVDGHSAGGNQIVDNELPSGINWTGAIVHIKNIRWSMLERQVTGSGGTTLTLNKGLSCLISDWGDCIGWGYFINNHLFTLDRDGEWYYDAGTRRVYLYSDSGTPANIEGSVVFTTDPDPNRIRDGGIMLSDGSETAYIIIDNFEIKNWFNHGIGTPGGMSRDIYHHITVRNVTIRDVNSAGVRLSSWLERPSNGRKGLRGGHHMTFTNNLIDGANHFGITGYFAESTFEDNLIRNIALIQNLGKSGMGCGQTSDECTENGDGIRIQTYDPLDSGYGNTLRYNRLERIGYNGVDVFGHDTTLEKNFITQSCYSKADCGGVRTFGTDNLSATELYNVRLLNNIIVDIPGNVDGCHPSRAAFGMGLYVDHYSRDVEATGNTVISTTITGINYQRSTGTIVGNTVYNASYGTEYAAHISLGGDETRVTVTNNILFGLNSKAWTLYSRSLSNWVSSDYNYLFHPYVDDHIAYGPSWTRYTFSGWQTFSGLEAHSKTNWFSQSPGEPPRSRIFYNDTAQVMVIPLGTSLYLDLDQQEVKGSLTLQPYTSRVLIYNGENLTPDLSPSTKTVQPGGAATGALVTYTIVIRNQGGPVTTTVRLTDTVPEGLAYLPGTLTVTLGVVDAGLAPTLRWSGVLSRTPAVTATYAVTVTASAAQAIVNTARVDDGLGNVFDRSATFIANPRQVYLPLILRNAP